MHTALLVVVDKLSKMTHLIPTTTQVTGEETARLYVDHVFKHHGCPKAIVSDRDPRFTGKFMTQHSCRFWGPSNACPPPTIHRQMDKLSG